MYGFTNDYSEGAHENILRRLAAINREQNAPYGEDVYSERARGLIRKELGAESEIYFFSGGTQANLTVISSFLRPHQGVISTHVGHIATHETGAIEATGHKVLTLPAQEGKVSAAQIEELAATHWADPFRMHTVQPGMVYLSHPTEVGTIYSKKELEEISAVCRHHNMLLYLDGARLGCALAAETNDVSLADLARLTDVFYIGGTKMGALFGEAVVVNNPGLSRDFYYQVKQKGARLAKGWLVGAQFLELFTGGLYLELARHANAMAAKLARGMQAQALPFLAQGVTNQVFPILPDATAEQMARQYVFQSWEKPDSTHTAIRLVTSWATREDMVDAFLADLQALR